MLGGSTGIVQQHQSLAIRQAKREQTPEKRVATAVVWLAEGKPRDWKYMDRWKS